MAEPTIIEFVDPHEGKAIAIVRTAPGAVGIALSIESNGDIQIFMPVGDAERFAQTLLQAIDTAKKSD